VQLKSPHREGAKNSKRRDRHATHADRQGRSDLSRATLSGAAGPYADRREIGSQRGSGKRDYNSRAMVKREREVR